MFKINLLTIATLLAISTAENVGWKSYFIENPTEFHDIPLQWEMGDQTTVPSWLSGIYVRNGPAQVNIYLTFTKEFFHLRKKYICHGATFILACTRIDEIARDFEFHF